MKKILLATAAAAILSSSAFAAEDGFYVDVHGAWSKMNKSNGFKVKNDFSLGLGLGYYIMDNARVSLSYDHYMNPKFTKAGTKTTSAVDGTTATTTNVTSGTEAKSIKGKADILMFNGYYDIFDAGAAKIFVGAGVGIGRLEAKMARSAVDGVALTGVTGTINNVSTNGATAVALANGTTTTYGAVAASTSKAKTNYQAVFAGHVGASYEVASGVNVDATYSYKHLGKTKKLGADKALTMSGHNIGLGVRFDI